MNYVSISTNSSDGKIIWLTRTNEQKSFYFRNIMLSMYKLGVITE